MAASLRRSACFVATLCLTCLIALPTLQADAEDLWQPSLDLSVQGSSDGDSSVGRIELLLPLWQDGTNLLSLAGQAGLGYAGIVEGSAGLFWRSRFTEGPLAGLIAGANAFFDYRHSANDNSFVGGGAGLELMTAALELRANGYLPSGRVRDAAGLNGIHLDIDSAALLVGREAALHGADAEIGARLWRSDGGDSEARVFLGGFWYAHDGFDTLAGPRGRAELRLYDPSWLPPGGRVVAALEGLYDEVRGGDVSGLVVLRLPLGGLFGANEPAGGELDRRMVDPVVRQGILTRAEQHAEPLYYMTADGGAGARVTGRLFLSEGGSGTHDGSSIENAMDWDSFFASGPRDGKLAYVVGNQGTIVTPGAVLDPAQALVGGGGTIVLQNASGSIKLPQIAPGLRPTVEGSDPGTNIVALSGQAQVIAIDFQGGLNALAGIGSDDVVLDDLAIDGTANSGIYLEASLRAHMTNLRISNVGGEGVFLFGGADRAFIDGLIVDGSAFGGLTLDASSDGTFRDIEARSLTFEGIALFNGSSGNSFAGVTVDDTAGAGIGVYDSSGNSFQGLVVSNTDFDSIFVLNGSDNSFTDSTLSNTRIAGSGILLVNADRAHFTNTSVDNVLGDGIFINDLDDVVFLDTTVTRSLTGSGVVLINDADGASFTNTTIENSDDRGVVLVDGVDNAHFVDTFITTTNLEGVGFGGIRLDTSSYNNVFDGGSVDGTGGGALEVRNSSVTFNDFTLSNSLFAVDITGDNAAATVAGSGNIEGSGIGSLCNTQTVGAGTINGAVLFTTPAASCP